MAVAQSRFLHSECTQERHTIDYAGAVGLHTVGFALWLPRGLHTVGCAVHYTQRLHTGSAQTQRLHTVGSPGRPRGKPSRWVCGTRPKAVPCPGSLPGLSARRPREGAAHKGRVCADAPPSRRRDGPPTPAGRRHPAWRAPERGWHRRALEEVGDVHLGRTRDGLWRGSG